MNRKDDTISFSTACKGKKIVYENLSRQGFNDPQ